MKTSKVFQLMALAIHTVAFIALFRLENNEIMSSGFGGHWKFFTIWTHTLNVIFYALSALNLLSKNHMSWIFKISFTSSICVSAMFWGIAFLDPNAFKIDPNIYPNWLNHAQHTVPCIIASLEMILVEYAYHSLALELLVLLSFAGSYLSFALYLKKANGWYPYPFMEQFTVVNWILFAIVAAVFAVMVHICGRAISRAIHGRGKATVTTGDKKKITADTKTKARKSKKIE